MADLAFFLFAFSSIFAIVNPWSTAAVFMIITKNDSDAKKKAMAKRACIVAFFIMLIFVIGGNLIFNFFSITVESLRIAGGIFVAFIGFKMLNPSSLQKMPPKDQLEEHIKKDDVSIVPLAMPFITGPGTISTVILLTAQNPTISGVSIILFSGIIAIGITYIILINSRYITRYLGVGGTKVLEKLLGLIILTVGVQFILNGIQMFAGHF
jgi:multiple antibiotic resistance protein